MKTLAWRRRIGRRVVEAYWCRMCGWYLFHITIRIRRYVD